MRIWKKVIAVFLTILVLLLGFFMPKLVLQYSDKKTESQVSKYELNDVSLSLSSQLWDRLYAVRDGYNSIVVDITVDTKMTEADVYEEMRRIDEEFGQMLLQESEILTVEAEPELVISRDGSLSFIVWRCLVLHEHGSVTMMIDDTAGKMLFFSYILTDVTDSMSSDSIEYGYVDSDSMTSDSIEYGYVDSEFRTFDYEEAVGIHEKELNIICEKLKAYYEIPEAYLSTDAEDSSSLGMEAYGDGFLFYITLKDENGNEVDLPYYTNNVEYYSING